MSALKKKVSGVVAAAVVAMGVSAAAGPASASSLFTIERPGISVEITPVHYKKRHHSQQHVLNKKQIKRRLRVWGYRDFKKVTRKGDVYIVKASWQGNHRARLVVDAYSGRILKHGARGY